VEEWLEREIGVKLNVKKAFKINKDKSRLKERKDERMYIHTLMTI
jgi:hypothetical protein